MVFYSHGGSGNHGCEAIARTTLKMLKQRCTIYSNRKLDDQNYGLSELADIKTVNEVNKSLIMHIFLYIHKLIMRNNHCYYDYIFKDLFKTKSEVCLSIGGDNYCYESYPEMLFYINKVLNENKCKTVLWGCSVEPTLLQNISVVDDLKRYSLITARESITFDAMKQAGINNVFLYPDPAFTLEAEKLKLPEGFLENNTIGINVSPLIQEMENGDNITFANYVTLVKYIIENTNFQIALIPHVVWNSNNDLTPLKALFNEFKDTKRVVLINDCNCMQLKGFIARCRIFVGARTHATIAAYSSCVPTLVIGYSVKARGIAKDIFGTHENYVLPVQSLSETNAITNAFIWILHNEEQIKKHLKAVMPAYIAKSWNAGEQILKLESR